MYKKGKNIERMGRREYLSSINLSPISGVFLTWIFVGRTDAEAEIAILWPPDAKNWLIWKDPDDGKDWGQEEKGMTEDEMAGWHHWLDGLESEWTPGVCDGQGGLACCDSWGRKELDTTERLNWTELDPIFLKQFQKTEEDGTKTPNLFYEATITLILKPDKDTTKKRKLQFNISN